MMNNRPWLSLGLAISTLCAGCGRGVASRAMRFDHVAIVGAGLVDLDSGRVLPDQTIYVADGRIRAIGSSDQTQLPPAVPIIDGRGKYVAPGLADMHVHHYTQPDVGTPYTDDDLLLYLANGVTTVRNMDGSPRDLAVKRRLASGTVLGPRYYTCGPQLGSWLTSETAARAVEDQAHAGYDCIKIYSGISSTAFRAMIETADRLDIPAVGHPQLRLGLDETLKLESIEHLEETLSFFGDPPLDTAVYLPVARRFAQAGVFVTPTITIFAFHKYLTGTQLEEIRSRPETRFVSGAWYAIASDTGGAAYRYVRRNGYAYHKRRYDFALQLIPFFASHGVRLLLGTDMGLLLAPGFAVHDELETLVSAGLTPLEALRTATSNVAEFFGDPYRSGRLEVGRNADLVLLDQNPLIDIRHTRRIVGVMIGREWLSRDAIGLILEQLRKR